MKQILILLLFFTFFFSQNFTQIIHVIQTAEFTGDRLTPKADITFQSTPISNITIKLSDANKYQTILGFGGAFTEAAAINFNKLNATLQQQIIEAYYVNLNYRVGRVPINSCDYSASSYSFDDTPDDYSLSQWKLSNGHDLHTVIPMIKAALKATGPNFHLFGSPWSPPWWMKSNGQMNGSNRPGLINDPLIYQSWALYFSKWISAYEAEGIPIWGITIQNEPGFDAPGEACIYSADQEADFLAYYLGPQLKTDYPDVKIMIYDYNKDDVYNYSKTILNRAEAAKYVDGVAFHWYSGPYFENVLKTHEDFPEYFLLASEACVCPGSRGAIWYSGEQYAYDIIGDLNSWAVGWVDWNMLLDMLGGPNHLNASCASPIMIDQNSKTIVYNSEYYYMGQFSKFILPGSVRIDCQIIGSQDIFATSFLTPDGQIVTVVMNLNDVPRFFDLEFNQKFAHVQLPQHSIATFSFLP